MTSTDKTEMRSAVVGGGCFWCLEAIYQRLPGVAGVTSGYAGGHVANPSYEEVCAGQTGHAEVVKVDFDPEQVSYEEILDLFWRMHDPTTMNRQGADTGTQYRSIILYGDERQKMVAENSRQQAQDRFNGGIVTGISPLDRFWAAEISHQDYYKRNTGTAYCAFNITPKIKKLGL